MQRMGKHVLTFILYLSVCSCMYPGLHQSSSNANSQGQASGWSLNRGTSIMAPASAQLTLTPAQEREDNKSQEQAAKAKRVLFESTGNEIYQRLFTRHECINYFSFFPLRKVIVFFSLFFIYITFWLLWLHSAEHS